MGASALADGDAGMAGVAGVAGFAGAPADAGVAGLAGLAGMAGVAWAKAETDAAAKSTAIMADRRFMLCIPRLLLNRVSIRRLRWNQLVATLTPRIIAALTGPESL